MDRKLFIRYLWLEVRAPKIWNDETIRERLHVGGTLQRWTNPLKAQQRILYRLV
jgi:hypothetical protein